MRIASHFPANLYVKDLRPGKTLWQLIFLFVGLMFTAGVLASTETDRINQELRHYVDIHKGAPGVIVGIIDGETQQILSYGTSSNSNAPELNADTRFEIGSITKTLTGALLAELTLSKEVELSQPLGSILPAKYLPSSNIENLTLEQLATHTSGLPRIGLNPASIAKMLSTDPYAGTTAHSVFSAAASMPQMFLDENKRMVYSNLGMGLLGQLLAVQSGANYESLLKQRVLTPLGLDGFTFEHDKAVSGHWARGHGIGGRPVPYWHVDGYAPAGGLQASMSDMMSYLERLTSGEVPSLNKAMELRKSLPGQRGIGLAWMHYNVDGRDLVWHDGRTAGFSSFIGLMPEEKLGIVILANGQGEINGLARRILELEQAPLAPPGEDLVGYGVTAFLLLLGPLMLFQVIQQTKLRVAERHSKSPEVESDNPPQQGKHSSIDKFDAVRRGLSPLLALILADRMGAWLQLPYALWWIGLAVTLALYLWLLALAKPLPWFNKSKGKLLYGACGLCIELLALVLLYL